MYIYAYTSKTDKEIEWVREFVLGDRGLTLREITEPISSGFCDAILNSSFRVVSVVYLVIYSKLRAP